MRADEITKSDYIFLFTLMFGVFLFSLLFSEIFGTVFAKAQYDVIDSSSLFMAFTMSGICLVSWVWFKKDE